MLYLDYMQKRLLIATTNPGKLREYKGLLADLGLQAVSLKEIGISADVEESGNSYQENAELKAKFYAKEAGLPALSDDGGLEIDALDGKPGIHSRRWVGGEGKDEDIIKKMMQIAKDLPESNRKAAFKVAISLALPNGQVWTEIGSVEGIIAQKPLLQLLHGYPYRSFFYLPDIKKYYIEDELSEDEQKRYNHRRKALEKLKPIIKRYVRH